MRPSERVDLLEEIGRELQSRMTTSDINTYFGAYGIDGLSDDIPESKRLYVKNILSAKPDPLLISIASELGIPVPTSVTVGSLKLSEYLTRHGLADCQSDFERALRYVEDDPSTALGMASSTLETVLKSILDGLQAPYPKNESTQHLLKAVFSAMDLSPGGHADQEIKQTLGGLFNVGAGLGAMRTRYSTFHGTGEKQPRLGARHARLAVNSLTALGLFLLETYHEDYAN